MVAIIANIKLLYAQDAAQAVDFQYVNRSANKVVHWTAKHAAEIHEGFLLGMLPYELQNLSSEDLQH